MSSSPLHDPEFLPFKLDLIARRVLLVRLTAAQRREAAFLDERVLPTDAAGGWMALDAMLADAPVAARAADAIFHIGHCGSTLLSRLLDSWPEVQGLREPLPLRSLAEAWPQLGQPQSRLSAQDASRLLSSMWSRWSRPLPPHTRSVVKATSSCNGLIAPLLGQHASVRALLLDLPLRRYLSTVLKAPASVHDAASAAGERLQYLMSCGEGVGEGVALHGLSLPQQCAMGWLAEQQRFDALAREHGTRALRLDFEALLAQPEATLATIATHLALDPAGVANALRSPAWGRYSKAQDHGYGRDDRAHDLALSDARHGDAIAEGVAWVDAFLGRYPGLRTAIAP